MKWSLASVALFCALASSKTESCNAFQLPHSKSTSAAPTAFVSKKGSFGKRHSNLTPFVSHRSRASVFAVTMTAGDQQFVVGIVGATGAVGKEIRQCLETREFPLSKLRVFGSERSAGKVMETAKTGPITIEKFTVDAARECDVVFLAVSGDFSREHAKAITAGDDGCVCIDNSSAFRYDPDIPLVVPEINGSETCKSKLIANPNCTTAIGLMAIWPLLKAFGLKKIIMSTYQAASGAGQPGMDELLDGTRAWLDKKEVTNSIFAHPLPYNVIPHIDKFQENGYTKEEMKVTWESRKICGLPDDFPVSCTAVRIPTIRAHSESIIVETEKPVTVEEARRALSQQPGLQLVDDPEKLEYPMPLTATNKYDVQVGRVRQSLIFGDHGLEFFVCGDQLLRGAALNAVLVAEEMVKNGSLKPKSTVSAA